MRVSLTMTYRSGRYAALPRPTPGANRLLRILAFFAALPADGREKFLFLSAIAATPTQQ